MVGSKKPETMAVHSGRMTREHFGTVNTPVYRTSTILQPDLATLESHNAPYVYGRRGTPTSRSFEEADHRARGRRRRPLWRRPGWARLRWRCSRCARPATMCWSRTAAYAPTRNFCDRMLKRYGIETDYYDPTLGAGIAALMKPNTRAVFCEAPGSLTFEMQDIPAIAAAARAKGASVLMDNTWATPLLFKPLDHGVDLSIQAVTKYIGGHADVMMGYVTANESHAERLAHTHGDMGLYCSGDDCFLALRGLRTLPVRLPRHQQTGLTLARWLQDRPEVERVLHPGLETDPGHAIWKRDFGGACGLFGVVLKPVSHAALAALMDGLSYFGMGYSWGGFESLIVPAHIRRTAKPFEAAGPVIRIHAGLEDPGDLIADLEAGFLRMGKTA